jgi:geranylgeranyl reductase
MKAHGQVFWVLGMMQRFWYASDGRRERFVGLCRDEDVQRLTFEAYMAKEIAKPRLLTHLRVFSRNLALRRRRGAVGGGAAGIAGRRSHAPCLCLS